MTPANDNLPLALTRQQAAVLRDRAHEVAELMGISLPLRERKPRNDKLGLMDSIEGEL